MCHPGALFRCSMHPHMHAAIDGQKQEAQGSCDCSGIACHWPWPTDQHRPAAQLTDPNQQHPPPPHPTSPCAQLGNPVQSVVRIPPTRLAPASLVSPVGSGYARLPLGRVWPYLEPPSQRHGTAAHMGTRCHAADEHESRASSPPVPVRRPVQVAAAAPDVALSPEPEGCAHPQVHPAPEH